MDRRRLAASLLLAAALVGMPHYAQAQEPDLALGIEDIDQRSHPEVTITVSMPRPLVGTEIPAEAFTVVEAGQTRPVEVRRLPNEDLEVILLLDLSESMSGAPLEAAVGAALAFVRQMPDEVRIAAVGFSTLPRVVVPFTDDHEAVARALSGLTAGGETALYDGLIEASGLWEAADDARRTIVLLSDGGDTVSAASLEQAILTLLDAEADFYAVELQSPETDPAPLARLQAATGGIVVPADDPDALASIFDEIAGVLVSQYAISFESAAHGPTELEVAVASGELVATASSRVQFPTPPPIEPSPEASPAPLPEPEPVATVPEPRAPTLTEPGLLSQRWSVLTGGALVFAGLWGLVRLLQTRDGEPNEPTTWQSPRRRRLGGKALSGLTNKATLLAERTLENRGSARGLSAVLEQAGIKLRPGEFVVLSFSAALGAAALGALFFSLTLGLALAVAAPIMMRLLVSARARRRKTAFADQLGDSLQLIAGSLQAGHGILQAIDAVASEDMPPASDEFRRLVAEVQLGRDFGEALQAMSHRVGGEDFQWVVDAIEIHREVGGDLAEILQTVAETIRDRNQIRRRIRTLSAEGRLSGTVLMALPFVVAAFVSFTNPDYMAELTQTSAGKLMIFSGLGFMGAGVFWIRRIVKLSF